MRTTMLEYLYNKALRRSSLLLARLGCLKRYRVFISFIGSCQVVVALRLQFAGNYLATEWLENVGYWKSQFGNINPRASQ